MRLRLKWTGTLVLMYFCFLTIFVNHEENRKKSKRLIGFIRTIFITTILGVK